jgi:hypothetical protein
MDTGMQGAIMRSLYNLGDQDPHICPGSCAWKEEFVSMGFGAQCKNVTEAVTATRNCAPSANNSGGQNCTFTTPGGIRLQAFIVPTSSQTMIQVNSTGTRFVNDDRQPISPRDFVRIGVFRAPETFNAGGREIAGQEIVECNLSLTAWRYSNLRANGTAFEQTVEQVPLLQNATRAVNNSIIFNEPGLPQFNMSRADWNAITQFFTSNQFQGTINAGDPRALNLNFGIGVLPLYKANIAGTFTNMTRAMTDQLRTTKPGMQIAFGLTDKAVAFIRVRWEYLILPVLIALCGALLLLIMVVTNRRSQGVPLWKSSVLAALYHTVKPGDGLLVGTHQSPKVLEEIAMGTKVRLD